MPFRAMSLGSLTYGNYHATLNTSLSPLAIDLVCHWFKMRWIHTGSMMAKMVEFQSNWDVP